LSAPGYVIKLSPARLDEYSTANSFYPPEAGANFSYSQSQVYIEVAQLPRYLPLKINFELSLDRPPTAQPALVEINEVVLPDYKIVSSLARLEQLPGQAGFQTYSVIVPARPEAGAGLVLQMKTNPFQLAGELNLRGVAVRQIQIQAADQSLFQPETIFYSFIVFSLLVVVVSWCLLSSMGYVESGFLALLIALTCAEQVQQLHLYTGWLFFCLLGLVLCLGGWWRTRRNQLPAEFGWVLGGLAFITGFFILGNSYWGDTALYQTWIAETLKYGPFDFYSHSATFNYPPLIVYFFWIYGHLANWAGLAGNELTLKIAVSLSLPAIVWLARRLLAHQTGQPEVVLDRKLTPVFLLFSFNLATLYNPAIWGQTEVLLTLFLLALPDLSAKILAGPDYVGFKPPAKISSCNGRAVAPGINLEKSRLENNFARLCF
jgi:hypothetical protein